MESFLTWLAGVAQDGIVGVTGGSIFMMVVLGLLTMTLFMWRFQVSMPFALMVSFFVIAVASQTLNNPVDFVLGGAGGGFTQMLAGILIVASALLLYHLATKKSQLGTG